MKKEIVIACLFSCCFSFSLALAQDKVVVIPLNSGATTNVAGTDKQMQYNDNGTQAGAKVYYDKTYESLGIGTNTPKDDLTIVDEIGEAGIFLGAQNRTYLNMESLGASQIRMAAINNDDTNTKYPWIMGLKGRGTFDNFQPVQAGDKLFGIFAKGQKTSGAADNPDYGVMPSSGIVFWAAEDWTNALANPSSAPGGSYISFFTTESGATGNRAARMIIDHNGNVAIGKSVGDPLTTLNISGLPTTPPLGSTAAGALCITAAGDLWVEPTGGPCPAAP